jgi:hypothetical protein
MVAGGGRGVKQDTTCLYKGLRKNFYLDPELQSMMRLHKFHTTIM